MRPRRWPVLIQATKQILYVRKIAHSTGKSNIERKKQLTTKEGRRYYLNNLMLKKQEQTRYTRLI
jgi:hypothetical protein